MNPSPFNATPPASLPLLRATLIALICVLGLAFPGVASASFLAPDTSITGGPDGETPDDTPTFAFSSPDTGAFQCRLDVGAFAACRSPFTTPKLSTGAHSFEVRGLNFLGGAGPPARRDFRVVERPIGDDRAPQTSISGGPAEGSTTGDTTPTFGFTADEAGAQFSCAIDGESFSACASPFTTPTLSLGRHSFSVRATDASGNRDASPAVRNFTVAIGGGGPPQGPTCGGQPATIVGTSGPDQLTGTGNSDVILAGDGNDVIDSGEGDDRVCAGPGDDLVNGRGGSDKLSGELGDDRIRGGKAEDKLDGGDGADELDGGGGPDKLKGGAGDDRLQGGSGKDRLEAGSGSDLCDGGGGKDTAKGDDCDRAIGVP